eukprot:Gb_34591 [translate_table: standard]
MGFVQIPDEAELAHSNHHRAIIELDKHELSETISLLKAMLEHITLHPSYFPLQTHPPQSTSSTTVNIITPAMASLKQRVGSINTHNSLQNIPNLMPISSPIGTPKASSQASTARSSRYSTEHFPAIRPGLHGIQGFHHHTPMSATNQGKVQTEQQTSSANISSSPREWANKSVEEKQATPRVASTSWGQTTGSNILPNKGCKHGCRVGLTRYSKKLGRGKFANHSISVFAAANQAAGRLHCKAALRSFQPKPRYMCTGGNGNHHIHLETELIHGKGHPKCTLHPATTMLQNTFGQTLGWTPPEAEAPQQSSLFTSSHPLPVIIYLFTQTLGLPYEIHKDTYNYLKAEAWSGVSGLVRVPDELSAWKRRMTTAGTKHNRDSITAMCYLPSFEELKGADDNSGWLISSSKKHLNLWQCTSGSSVSEPSLQVMNSQTTEFVMEDMSVDMDAKLLCSFCPHPQDKALCIAMHSLGGPAFFKFQGLIHIPCEDSLVSRRQGIFGIQMLHLASLWPMGGPLGSSIAGAFGKNAFVYDLSSVSAKPSVTVPPKALWQAHDSPISCIYQSSFVCALFTGASDGCVRLWDMKSKPSNPVRQYLHKKHVTGIEMLDGRTICSSSLDGSIQLRDLRYGTSPFMSAIPDEKPILNMASLPLKNMIAFSSRGGLFCLQVASGNPTDADAAPGPSSSSSTPSMRVTSSLLWPLTPLPSVGPCTGIKWNTKTSTEIYTSELDGSITVFAK